MSFELLSSLRSFIATGSFASKQYTFVKLDTSGQLATPSSGGSAIGVIQDTPAAGKVGAVTRPGDVTKVQCGGSFNIGDYVMSDSGGKAVVATSGSYILGQALEAGALNKIASIVLQGPGSKL